MKNWLKKTKNSNSLPSHAAEAQVVGVFDNVFNPNNDAPVRVRSVKEFVVNMIEESRQKDSEISKLNEQLEKLNAVIEERDVARLALERADLVREKLKREIDQLKKKIAEQKQKNQKLRDENNNLKLKLAIKRTRTTKSAKEKK